MLDILDFIGSMLEQILAIQMPWGFSFGVTMIGAAFFVILIGVLRTMFTSLGHISSIDD